ncbi:MAG: hypothetical protein GY720_14360 [bacterium]|nr:hypothetical protein [bacterium]
MRRIRAIAMIWLATALVASACGGSDEDSTDSPQTGAEIAATSPVIPPDEPPPNLASVSFVNNLLAKETDGEWSRGEGLVATLQVFAGEKGEAEILRHPELLDREGTGIIAMARDYVDDGADDEARDEIERLLDLVTYSGDRLDAMAGLAPTVSLAGMFPFGTNAQAAETDCRKFFREGVPAGVGQCLEVRELYVLDVLGEGPYRVFIPAPSLPDAGWTETHYDLALKAMEESVVKFSKLDGVREVKMTPVNLVFSVADDGYATADPAAGLECGVVLDTTLQTFTDVSFKQVVAHEMAHCFQTEAFVPQNKVNYEYTRWREEGLAEFLGNVVYPKNDLEWDQRRMKKLAEVELKTTLFQRAYTNFMLFQYLYSEGGHPAVFGVVDSLPTVNGHQQQKDALAGLEGMLEAYHEFMKTVTDELLQDSGGGYGPYDMVATNRPTVDITSPGTAVAANVKPFGGLRRRLVVPEGKQACLTWDKSNLFVEHRPDPDGEWTPLPVLFPIDPEDPGTTDLVVTATDNAAFGLVVSSVHKLDEEQDGTLIGEWIVDNASIRGKVGYIAPVQTLSAVSGRISVTFRDDGTVRMAYSSFRVAGHSDVQMEDGAFSTNMQSTFDSVTDAAGVDGYRVTGDYIFYDSMSERDFLSGTETVTYTSQGFFIGIDAGSFGIEFEVPEDSTDDYPASGWALLGAANQLRFACGGNILLLDSVVLRRAG